MISYLIISMKHHFIQTLSHVKGLVDIMQPIIHTYTFLQKLYK